MIENTDDDFNRRIFQLAPIPCQLRSNPLVPITFRELLLGARDPGDVLVKRRLALTVAHSVLQLHDNALFGNGWTEDNISFFQSDGLLIDFEQPYIDSPMSPAGPDAAHNKDAREEWHPNLGILRLGILLLEVHTWRPIEGLQAIDNPDAGETTTTIHSRVMAICKALDTGLSDCLPGYQSATRACVDIGWLPVGARVSLEDPETCEGLYRHVITPIQEEITYVEKMAKKYGHRGTSLLTPRFSMS